MLTETTVVPCYDCPHCHVRIQSVQTNWHGWERCPRCERSALPPERARVVRTDRRPASPPSRPRQESPEEIYDLLSKPAPLAGEASAVSPPAPRSSAPRLIVSTGLFVSAFLLLNAYLDRSTQSMALFGTLTVVFLAILVRIRMSGRP